eukprot:1171106-Pleurochrysis_carterae.AAC.1
MRRAARQRTSAHGCGAGQKRACVREARHSSTPGDTTRFVPAQNSIVGLRDDAYDEPSSGFGSVRGGGCAKRAAKGSGASNAHLLSGQVSRSRMVAMPLS